MITLRRIRLRDRCRTEGGIGNRENKGKDGSRRQPVKKQTISGRLGNQRGPMQGAMDVEGANMYCRNLARIAQGPKEEGIPENAMNNCAVKAADEGICQRC